MTIPLNVLENQFSSPDFSYTHAENSAGIHLVNYLKKLKIEKFFSDHVMDPRKGKITYPLVSLLYTALATVFFRMGSKHAFHEESRKTVEDEQALAKFAGIPTEELPVTRTVDDVLSRLSHEEMNEVLLSVFELLRKDKFFADHPFLTPASQYQVAIDAESIHTYTPNSDHDCKKCPFCLKRQRGQEIWYLHMHVAASLVCPGGVRIPLYLYPIHAKSLNCDGTVSHDKFKQECELTAFPAIIQKLRERFPRLKFCILLDSLYANGPAIKTLKENRMEFMIVRKDGSMKTVGQDCDGLEKIFEQKTTGRLEETGLESGRRVKRVFRFFNEIDYQDMKLNILRFEEWIFNKNGEQISYVHWEWIVSWKISKKNAPPSGLRGRMRWLEEDLFNTLKNRGFNIKHDYSRNPTAQLIWMILIMLAFLITELFNLIRKVTLIKRNRSLKDFMRAIFYELRYLYKTILKVPIAHRRSQIRYCFEKGYFSADD